MNKLEKDNKRLKDELKITKLTLASKTENPSSKEESLRQSKAIAAIKEAIEDSGKINGMELF